jgi:hypothetical protein
LNEKLNAFHIVILIHMTQVGVTIFSLPRICATHFGTNGWIAILPIGLVVFANVALIHAVVRLGGGRSLPEMLGLFLPKPVYGALLLGMSCMYALSACLTSKQYVLMYELQSFPATRPYVFRAGIDILIFFLVIIGIYNLSKAVTVIFFSTIVIPFTLLSLYDETELVRYTPFFLKEGTDFMAGCFEVYAAYLGFEISLFLIPYVGRSTRWFRGVYVANTVTTVVYLILSIIAFGFFSYGQLRDMLYPLLEMTGHVQLPIIERVDTLMFTFFFLVALVTATLYFWIATELFSYVFPKLDKRWPAAFLITVTYFVSSIPNELDLVTGWLRIMGKVAIATAIALPLLLIGGMLITRARRAKAS